MHGLASIDKMTNWKPLELGLMNVPCSSCHALHWIDERSKQSPSTKRAPRFEECCKKGDVVLQKLQSPPEILEALVSAESEEAKWFRKNIREYNSALSFTSLKYSPDNRAAILGAGVDCFQIHGELYHLQGPLEPEAGQVAKFSQLFLYDPDYAAKIRHDSHPELDNTILEHRILLPCSRLLA